MKRLSVAAVLLITLQCNHLVASFCPFPPSQAHVVSATSRRHLSSSSNADNNKIRYLGRGPDALVKEGVVLVAPKHEFSTYLLESAVFVYAIGYDDFLEADVIRGVVLDYPSAFIIGEMSPAVSGTLSNNILFRGGSEGGDSVIMLHSNGSGDDQIGTSGVYEGGLQQAMEACDEGTASPSQFKFFFNYCQFRVKELEDMLEDVQDGDAWVSVQVPPEYVLNSDWGRGECWKQLRNAIRQYIIEE